MAKITTKAIAWLPSAAAGTSITPSGSAWGNTGWTQFSASTAGITQLVAVTYTPGVAADFEIEFATGGAGAEVGIGSLHARALSTIATGGNYELMLGAIIDKVPNATRLSMRLRTDSTDVTAWKFAIGYMLADDSTDLSDQVAIVTPGAQNLSATVSSGGTWTSGAYLQTTTGISTDQLLTSLSISSGGTTEEYEIDIGVGSAGNEVVVTTIRANVRGNNGTGHYVMPNPVFLQGNTRIATRVRAASGTYNTFIALNTTPAMYLNISVSDSSAVTESKSVEGIMLISKSDSSAATESVTMSWPLAETFQENFNFGGIDSGKWTSFGGGVVMGTNLDVEITSNNDYEGINSLALYNLTGSYMYSQVVDAGNQTLASFEVYPVYLILDANNKLYIRISGGTVQPIKVVANVATNLGTGVAYNSTTMKYFRIRESGGTTFFDYAADPTSTWTNITSAANPIAVTALTLEILVGTWNLQNSTAKLDNVNTYPAQYQFSWKGYTWNQRIHQGAPANKQWWSATNVSGPDGSGYLTFTLSNPSATPYGGEMFSDTRGWGYGIYTSVIGTQLNTMDHRIGWGGLFTFDFTAPPDYKEIDSSEVRDYNSNTNIRILHSHVYNNAGAGTFIVNDQDVDSSSVQTHQLIWTPNSLTFNAYTGTGTGGTLYFQSIQSTNLPTPGLERVHFNIWNNTNVANNRLVSPFSVTVRDFTFAALVQITPSENSTVTDISTVEIVNLVNVTETSIVTENIAAEIIDNISVTDSSAVTESVTVRIPMIPESVSDASTVTDVIAVELINLISCNDTSAVSESVAREMIYLIQPAMVDQQQLVDTGLDASGFEFGSNAVPKQAQSFKPTITARIAQVSLSFGAIGSPIDAIRLQIYSDSSGSPGSLLATADSTITTLGHQTLTFTNGPSLTAATTYWLVLSRTGSLDDVNLYQLLGTDATTDYYINGGAFFFNGSSWATDDNAPGFFPDAYFQESYTSAIEFSTATDVVSQVLKINFLNVSDSSIVTESITPETVDLVNVSDSSAVTESITVTIITSGISINVNDTSTVTESVTMLVIDFLNVNDLSTASENITLEEVYNISVLDSSIATDVIGQILNIYTINVSETSTVTESIALLIPYGQASVSDASGVTDVPIVEEIDFISITDSTTASENTIVELIDLITVTDSSTVTDAIGQVLKIYTITVSDTSAATDVLTQVLEIDFINVTDNSAVSESVIVLESSPAALTISVSDSSAVTDSSTIEVISLINVNDTSVTSENTTVEEINLINVFDGGNLALGLVAYYSFDENSGSTVGDLSGKGNNGTWQVASSWAPGIINSGGNFTGTNYVSCGNPSNLGLSGNSPFTISAWVNPSASNGGSGSNAIFDYGAAVASERISLIYIVDYSIRSSHFSNDHTFTTKLDQNAQNHIVLTYDGTTESLYKNGVFKEAWNPTALSLVSGGALLLGNSVDAHITGATVNDEIGLWNRGVSANEVAILYNNGKGAQFNGSAFPVTESIGTEQIYNVNVNDTSIVTEPVTLLVTDFLNVSDTSAVTDTPTVLQVLCPFAVEGFPPGLIAYYSYDENTGTLVGDSTGNGHNGTWNGTLGSQWTAGKINSGGNFNGSDNGVQATLANPLLDGSFSFSAWVYFNVFQAADTDSIIKVDVGTDFFWAQLYVHNYAGLHHARFILDDGAGHQSPTSLNTTLSTGQWYHLVAVRDTTAGQVILYLNGASEGNGTDSSTTVPTYTNLYMGQNGGPTTQFLNGTLDEVALFNRALSATEASRIFNNGRGTQFIGQYLQAIDVATSEIVNLVSVADTSVVTEAAIVEVIDFISVTDQSTVTEVVTALIPFYLISITDQSAVTDTAIVELINLIAVSDSSAVSDVITQILETDNINVSDQPTASESTTAFVTNFIVVSDTSTASDISTVEIVNFISVNDTSTGSDVVTQVLITYFITVTDTSTALDVVSQVLEIYFIIAGENSSVTESETVTIVTAIAIISVFDSSTVTDVLTQVMKIDFITAFDSSVVTSVLSGQNGGIYLNPLDISVFEFIGPYFLIFVDGRPAIRLFNNFYTFI